MCPPKEKYGNTILIFFPIDYRFVVVGELARLHASQELYRRESKGRGQTKWKSLALQVGVGRVANPRMP